MVSVCSTDGKRQVIPLNPPAECKPGDRVVVKGYEHETAGGKVVENKRVSRIYKKHVDPVVTLILTEF